jgi:uroporphyrinogen III methyltransferase / synthase
MSDMKKIGTVYLVGAGPGDPGLITVKGRDCIKAADTLIYDYLAAEAFLTYARPEAEKIYVGKKGGDHTLPQEEINRLLVAKAKEGKLVVRLKGGDPFVFGRGGEEIEELLAAGVAFEVVPGVTSAVAAPAYAGIPLTHRKFTSTVAFVTGHEDPTKSSSSIDWASLAGGIGTLVFFMGVKNLPHICQQLLKHGRSGNTPVALVRWGTTPRQQTVTGTIDNIVERVRAAKLKAPAIIVVGGVVGLREQMQWFERRPLFGKRIIVTRARRQASALVERLNALGAACLQCPTIRLEPPASWDALDAAVDRLDSYHWLVFTSVNGVDPFFQRLDRTGRDARALAHLKTAVIGPATAERLGRYDLRSDIVPANYRAESVVAAFAEQDLKGKRILLPRAKEARPILPVELTRMGARVDEIAVYETVMDGDSVQAVRDALTQGEVDLVTFTSSSTVTNFHQMLPEGEQKALMKAVQTAAIGPITARTARDLGFKVDIEAQTYTIDGLVEAILEAQL